MLRFEEVYKIFGDKPKVSMELLQAGKSKDEIRSETGQVVGIQNINCEVKPGEIFVVMGLSGSGKSTLLRCANRLVEPTSGKILLENEKSKESMEVTALDTQKLRKLRREKLAMVFQHFALFPRRTVLANVTYGLEIRGMKKEAREKKALEALELVGLKEWISTYPQELSGGMQQRVGLARALATEAEILLMDEPFSALDPLIKVNMQDELLEIQDRLKRTVLFVTHDLDEALKLGDHIGIMNQEGKIVQKGNPQQIIVHPETEYVERFVENADPSRVLTADVIATTIDKHPSHFIHAQITSSDNRKYLIEERGELFYCLDNNGKPIRGILKCRRIPIQKFQNLEDIEEIKKVIVSVGENTSVHEVMKIQMESDFPVIITSNDGNFKGIISKKNTFAGLVEKGRSQVKEQEEYLN